MIPSDLIIETVIVINVVGWAALLLGCVMSLDNSLHVILAMIIQ